MRRIPILCLIMGGWLLTTPLAFAQSVRGSMGFFQVGYLNAPQIGAVTQAFAPDWFPSLNDHFIYSGAEGWVRRNRLMVGLSATALTAQSVSKGSIRVDRNAGLGQLKIGYVLVDHRQWMVYSSVGQGFSSTLVSVESLGTESVVWMLPSHTTDAAVHFYKVLIPSQPAEDRTVKGLWLGIRMGYLTSARSSLWQQIPEGYPLRNKPSYALHGFYLTLTVGGGRFHYPVHP